MKTSDVQPGITVIVPAGADITRKTPYCLQIAEVQWARPNEDMAGVSGWVYRLDGSPSRRGNAYWGTRQKTAHRTSIIRPSRLQLVDRAEPDDIACGQADEEATS